MKIGFQLMLRGAAATPEGLERIVRTGEASGFDLVAPNDHIVVPDGIGSTYPYTADGIWPGAAVGECHEQLTAATFIAGRTERIGILTSVMVVPYRAPVLTAKILATADVLSGGRLIVGCGAGWMAEEIAAMGGPPFSERGRVTDEYIRVFKELWTSPDPRYDGQYTQFADIHFKPLPLQKPHPPIWIGGESLAALRRAARLGDGWYPAANNPRHRITDPASLAARFDVLRRICDEEERDSRELDIGFFYAGAVSGTERPDDYGGRTLMTGRAADIADDIAAFAKAGAGTLVFIFQRPDLSATLEQMEWFGSEVIPLVRQAG